MTLRMGIGSGLLRPSTWRSEEFVETIHWSVEQAPNVWVGEDAPDEQEVSSILEPLIGQLEEWEPEIPLDIIREVSRDYINRFVTGPRVTRVGSGSSLFDFRLEIPQDLRAENQVLKAITIEYLLRNEITAGVFFKGHEILKRLFDAFYTSCRVTPSRERYLLFPRRLRPKLREVADSESDLRRGICDYLAGLTEGAGTATLRPVLRADPGKGRHMNLPRNQFSPNGRLEGRHSEEVPKMEYELHVQQLDEGGQWIILENGQERGRFVRRQDARAAAREMLRDRPGGIAVIHSSSGNISEQIVAVGTAEQPA